MVKNCIFPPYDRNNCIISARGFTVSFSVIFYLQKTGSAEATVDENFPFRRTICLHMRWDEI